MSAPGRAPRRRTADWRRRAAVVALALAAVSGVGCRRTSAMVGKQAPEFSLSDLSGHAVRLANFRGRIVFLNVWATWCAPCREEMPSMQALSEGLRGPDFEMLAVNADQGGRDLVERFVRDFGLTFPILLDPDLQIADRYGVTGYPETFLIDRNGVIVAHEIGPRDWDTPQSHDAFRRLIERGEWPGL